MITKLSSGGEFKARGMIIKLIIHKDWYQSLMLIISVSPIFTGFHIDRKNANEKQFKSQPEQMERKPIPNPNHGELLQGAQGAQASNSWARGLG